MNLARDALIPIFLLAMFNPYLLAQETPTQITLNNGNSYDFSTGQFGNFTGGDLYLTGLKFWANNQGQRGVISLGDIGEVDLNEVSIPTDGYSRQGVAADSGHTYASLAQEGEEGNFIVFRVDSISGESVTLSFVYLTDVSTSVDDASKHLVPGQHQLHQNYPNPFNPSTNFSFALPKTEFATLKIYNTLGQEVAILVADVLSAGDHNYAWQAGSLPSGVYVFRLQAGDFVENRKMILLQ